MKMMRVPLRVVFYYEQDQWVAHCLEFDLLGSGDTKQEALDSLTQAICLQIEFSAEHNNLANLFTPADGLVFQRFAAGRDIAKGELEIHLE